MNITGNIISGQVSGETAKQLSDRFGKIMQDRTSLSINRADTSISKSKQLELAIPTSKISGLSSGDFVGMVADDPKEKIELKVFHAAIVNDDDALDRERRTYRVIPISSQVTTSMVYNTYNEIRQEIEDLVNSEMEKILNDPRLTGIHLKK